MPAPVIPNPVLIFVARVLTLNGAFANISYWEPTSSITTSAALNTMCNDFNTAFSALYAAVMNTGTRYIGCEVTYKNGATLLNGSKGVIVAGTLANTPVSDQNAVVIRKLTGKAGRQNRGRYFIGGMDSSCFDLDLPDEVAAAMVTPYRNLAAAYGADKTLNGQVVHARHWDRKNNQLVPITECKISSRIASRDDRRNEAVNIME